MKKEDTSIFTVILLSMHMKETLSLGGMHCDGCVASVKRTIERLPVIAVDVSLGTAIVEYDAASLTREAIVKAIEDAGYEVKSTGD